MKYTIENGKNYITVTKGKEIARVYILPERMSIFEVLKILVENAVEPCHAQNVFDDLMNK